MKKFLGLVLIVFIGLGCSTKQKGLIYFNDFESIKGWTSLYLNKEPHRSGSFSNKLDSTNIYGLTFKLRFKDISDRSVKKVKVGFWVLLTEMNAQSKLVIQVDDKDKNKIFYIAKNIDEFVKAEKKWTKINLEFTFPSDNIILPDNVINIYAWNLSKKDIYIDDEKIEFVVQ